MQGKIRPGGAADAPLEVVDDAGVVLAVGHLVVHPGSQMIVEDRIASAVQFSGALTDAGLRAVTA